MSSSSQTDCAWPTARAVLAVLVIALLVRGGALWLLRTQLDADPDAYRQLADTLAATGTFGLPDIEGRVQPTAYRPPLYPMALAALSRIPIRPAASLALFHLVLGVATVAVVLWLARPFRLGRFGYVAALLVTCDPILLNQSVLVMTETLATLLAVVALGSTIAASARPVPGRWLAAGAAFGLAAQCRSVFLVPALLVIVFITLRTMRNRNHHAKREDADARQGFLRVAAFALGLALVLVPWIARNYLHSGRLIVATTHGGYTLRLGNNPSFYAYLREGAWGSLWNEAESLTAAPARQLGKPAPRPLEGIPLELARDRYHYEQARAAIEREPAMFVWSCLVRMGRLWQLLPHQVNQDESVLGRLARWLVALWYLAVFSAALLGAWSLRGRLVEQPWLWVVLLCAAFTLVHAIYWSNMRMRAPLVPGVALLAAAGAARLHELRKAARPLCGRT